MAGVMLREFELTGLHEPRPMEDQDIDG